MTTWICKLKPLPSPQSSNSWLHSCLMSICKFLICLLSHTVTVKEELKLDKIKNAKSFTTQRRNQRLYLPLNDGNGQTARPSNIYYNTIKYQLEIRTWDPWVASRRHYCYQLWPQLLYYHKLLLWT